MIIITKYCNTLNIAAKTIIQHLEEEKLSTFLELIKYAGLEDAFEKFGEYTLFVPSETAMLCK